MALGLPVLDKKRKCGACKVCCTFLEVPELQKPANTTCPNVCSEGCAIHDHAPPSCVGYYCAWRWGYFTDDDRPDKLGMIFSLAEGTKLSPHRPLLVADEWRSGAHGESRPDAVIRGESRNQLILVRLKNELRVMGPPAELRRVAPLMEETKKAFGIESPITATNEAFVFENK